MTKLDSMVHFTDRHEIMTKDIRKNTFFPGSLDSLRDTPQILGSLRLPEIAWAALGKLEVAWADWGKPG